VTNSDGTVSIVGIQVATYATSAQPVPQGPAFIPTGTGCVNLAGKNSMTCPNLYAGTAVVTAAASGTTPINSYVTTIPAPAVVTYCNPGSPTTGQFDGQKNCPAMTPVMVLGRN
jgi:hypothetical protein